MTLKEAKKFKKGTDILLKNYYINYRFESISEIVVFIDLIKLQNKWRIQYKYKDPESSYFYGLLEEFENPYKEVFNNKLEEIMND